jgi:hypothetical protein
VDFCGSDIVGRVDHVVVVSKDGDRSLGHLGLQVNILNGTVLVGRNCQRCCPIE